MLTTPVTWESSDDGVLTVSKDGLVTAVGWGIASITARAGETDAAMSLTALNPSLSVEATAIAFEADLGRDVALPMTVPITITGATTTGRILPLTFRVDGVTYDDPTKPTGWLTSTIVGLGNTAALQLRPVTELLPQGGYGAVVHLSAVTERGQALGSITLPITVGIERLTQLSGARDRTCGITGAGRAYCWGANESGQLGDGTLVARPLPTPVATTLRFKAISTGHNETCGLTPTGTIVCWGYGRTTPGPEISVGLPFVGVSVGFGHACGWTNTGGAWCWGLNDKGQLGNGTTTRRDTPGIVPVGLTFQDVSAGVAETCGVTTDGSVYCWGDNSAGQLGNGTTTASLLPARVTDFTERYKRVRVNADFISRFVCGLTTSDRVRCWGDNSVGGLGDGTTVSRTTPSAVNLGVVTELTVGSIVACARESNLAVRCWGDNRTLPQLATTPNSFRTISTGYRSVCGVAADARLSCWTAHTSFRSPMPYGPTP